MSNTLTDEVVYTAQLAVGPTPAPGEGSNLHTTAASNQAASNQSAPNQAVANSATANQAATDTQTSAGKTAVGPSGNGAHGTGSGGPSLSSPSSNGASPNGTAQHSTAQHSTAQHSTAQNGTGTPRPQHTNGHPKPVVAKRVLTGVASVQPLASNGHAAAPAPSANKVTPAASSPIVGVAMLVAEPVYEIGDAESGTIDQVVEGIHLGIRKLATAAGLSCLMHCILLTLLGLFAAGDFVPLPPYLASEVAHKEPLVLEVTSPPAEVTPPVIAKIDVTPKTAGVTQGNIAAGIGSAGSRGGAGGGHAGAVFVPGVEIQPLKQIASGGNGGLGVDKAVGGNLTGDAGEPVPTSATFFGIKADGKSFAFVVDTSGSMSANLRYIRCRDELIRSVSSLHYKQKYFIVFFNHEIFAMPERKLVEAQPKQLRQTLDFISRAAPMGFTEPWPGLLMAIRMKPDAIYLLTDGEFDTAVIEKVVAAQPDSKKIPIHTIAFESQAGEPTLQTIARITGGTYRYVP